jgi:archaemetzincin
LIGMAGDLTTSQMRRRLLQGSASMLVGTILQGCVQREAERQDSKTAVRADPSASKRASPTTRSANSIETVGSDGSSATKTIYLQPLGDALAESDLEFIYEALRRFFPFELRRLPTQSLPRDAYYPPRRRYRAERLLEHLERHTPADAQVVVGLTQADISTTKGDVFDWGVLGLATLSGKQCVISRFRAQRNAKSPKQVQERLAKTVVHEVGHTIGLPHCPNYGCIMEDGKGTVTTTDHERDVCDACRARVGELMLPRPAQLPW